MTNPVSRVTDEKIEEMLDPKWVQNLAARITVDVCEIERDSPEDDPMACIVYAPELDAIVERRVTEALIELQSLRALSPNSEGEAVAWRWPEPNTGGFYVVVGSQPLDNLDRWQPLYIRPQPHQVEVSDEMVERACRDFHPTWDFSMTPGDHEWHSKNMRAALTAALRSDQK